MQKCEAKVARNDDGMIGTNGIVCFHDNVASAGEFHAHGLKARFRGMLHRMTINLVEWTSHDRPTCFVGFKDQGTSAQVQTTFNFGHVRRRTRIFVRGYYARFSLWTGSAMAVLGRFFQRRLSPLDRIVGFATGRVVRRVAGVTFRLGRRVSDNSPILKSLLTMFKQQLGKSTASIGFQVMIKVTCFRIQDLYRILHRYLFRIRIAAAEPRRDGHDEEC